MKGESRQSNWMFTVYFKTIRAESAEGINGLSAIWFPKLESSCGVLRTGTAITKFCICNISSSRIIKKGSMMSILFLETGAKGYTAHWWRASRDEEARSIYCLYIYNARISCCQTSLALVVWGSFSHNLSIHNLFIIKRNEQRKWAS